MISVAPRLTTSIEVIGTNTRVLPDWRLMSPGEEKREVAEHHSHHHDPQSHHDQDTGDPHRSLRMAEHDFAELLAGFEILERRG